MNEVEFQSLKQIVLSKDPSDKNLARQLLQGQKITQKEFLTRWGLYQAGIKTFGTLRTFYYDRVDIHSKKLLNVEFLADFPHINFLNLSKNKLNHLQGLDRLKKIYFLDISNNPLSDIAAISALTKIISLVANNTLIENISPLQKWDNLRDLNLAKSKKIDFNPLKGINSLKNLSIQQSKEVDWASMDNLQIEELNCWETGNLYSNKMPYLPQLRRLLAQKNKLSELEFILINKKINFLDISNNPIKNINVCAQMENLIELKGYNCGIDSLTNWENSQLKFLHLDNNNIANVKGLSGLKNLQVLTIENNPVQNFAALLACSGLKCIRADKVSRQEHELFSKELPNCSFYVKELL